MNTKECHYRKWKRAWKKITYPTFVITVGKRGNKVSLVTVQFHEVMHYYKNKLPEARRKCLYYLQYLNAKVSVRSLAVSHFKTVPSFTQFLNFTQ